AVGGGISDFGFRISDLWEGEIGKLMNRGADSIGLSDRLQFVDRFDREGVLGRVRVVGFVERQGRGQDAGAAVAQSCDDVAVADFPVIFGKLDDYLRFAVSAQVAGNGYDDLAGVLAKSDRPSHAVVVVGGTQGVGGSHGVAAPSRGLGGGVVSGDVCHSVVYDSAVVTCDEIAQALGSGETGVLEQEGVSWLRQVVG
ncbi:MAG: DUF5718 family protein, partial [Planctomycetota bacterium]